MSYNAENMSGICGNDCTDEQANNFAEYLINQGWELHLYLEEHASHEQYYAHRDGEEMTETEWAEALADYE